MGDQRNTDQTENRAVKYMCVTCGTEFPASPAPPAHCPICEDDRQYVNPDGQQWTTLADLQSEHRNRFYPVEPGVSGIVTEPKFAIGQRAFLIQTEHGNVLWEALSLIDETTAAVIDRFGGVDAIGISHPHYYSSMDEWSKALGDVPIFLPSADRKWVVQPSDAIRFWDGDTVELLPGVTMIRCGGHFPGASVLHWADGAEGQGLLFSGDTIQVVADRDWVTFMYSYPNVIPLDPASINHIVDAVGPYQFERIYGAFGRDVLADAKRAVRRSAERYIRHLQDPSANAG